MKKKEATTFVLPDYVREIFKASKVAEAMSAQYAEVAVKTAANAWKEVDRLHPQIDGHYYSYDGNGMLMRHKREAPKLLQK